MARSTVEVCGLAAGMAGWWEAGFPPDLALPLLLAPAAPPPSTHHPAPGRRMPNCSSFRCLFDVLMI